MRLLSIVSTRFWYFRSLINEAHQKETSDSMITDYLDRMKTAQESREETSFSSKKYKFLPKLKFGIILMFLMQLNEFKSPSQSLNTNN